jgi:hypothetical protein
VNLEQNSIQHYLNSLVVSGNFCIKYHGVWDTSHLQFTTSLDLNIKTAWPYFQEWPSKQDTKNFQFDRKSKNLANIK